MLSSGARTARRFDASGLDEGEGLAFSGNPDIGVGAVAVPEPGQQLSGGLSWVDRLPSLEDQLTMRQFSSPPGR